MASAAFNTLIDRQFSIANGDADPLPLPKHTTYSVCNLRGGIGKTSITFNLSYLADDVLCVDTCPQCNLTAFFDNDYLRNTPVTVYSMLEGYFIPNIGKSTRVAKKIDATNAWFQGKNSYFIPSDQRLYMLPSVMTTAINQIYLSGTSAQRNPALDSLFYSLRTEIEREMSETGTKRCIIDTSPFFSGATHLAWHACDAMVIPVRTDQQSINSLAFLLDTLSNPASEFRRIMPSDNHTPKIQMVVLTHCGWSTVAGSRNVPNRQTRIYIEKVFDAVSRNITHFTTDNPENHVLLLDDFLGTGRISSARSKPILKMTAGESATIHRVKTEVNASVTKVQRQLEFMYHCMWN